jgi:hypothetical protein
MVEGGVSDLGLTHGALKPEEVLYIDETRTWAPGGQHRPSECEAL